MFGDYRRNSSRSAIFTPPRSRDRCKNSSAAMFTTQRNHSHSHCIKPAMLRAAQVVIAIADLFCTLHVLGDKGHPFVLHHSGYVFAES